jgi:hypothetical protein
MEFSDNLAHTEYKGNVKANLKQGKFVQYQLGPLQSGGALICPEDIEKGC